MKISSVDPNNTIGSALTRRSNKVGDIVRFQKNLWGLREWYQAGGVDTQGEAASEVAEKSGPAGFQDPK